MKRSSRAMRQGRNRMIVHGFTLLLIMLFFACGDGSDRGDISADSSPSESKTGSAVLKIQWFDASPLKEGVQRQDEDALNCADAGVATITCKVYDESNNLLTTGDPWSCSEHSGSLDGILVGQNRMFVILGADDEGNIIFQGQKPNITIDKKPDNDVGTIAAYAFVPGTLAATTSSALQINLVWTEPDENVSAAGYRIYRDGAPVGTSASTSYSDTGLTQSTRYCYIVKAYDAFGNESGSSNQSCATTAVSSDEDPPSVPTNLTAQALSASQIDLTWTASSDNVGVTEYRIYRDGEQAGTSASTSYSDTGLTQNTQHCYTIEAYDAAGNGSGQSGQRCATTLESFDWYRDRDNDNYGDPNDSVISETQPEGYVSDYSDCNDENPSIHPGATESCNGDDDDCDGSVDEELTRSTTCGVGACTNNTGIETCVAGVWGNDTCDPLAGATSERCDNVDNDCDGSVDEGLSRSTSCGVGACADNTGTETCSAGIWGNDTCDPLAGATSERCNDIDDDCDGEVDNGLSFSYYYWDDDEDDYGDPYNRTYDCEMPPGYVSDNTDCNDDNIDINPGAEEVCYDGIDNNCDSAIDNYCSVINPTSSFTARLISGINVLVGDANDHEGEPFNSTFLSIKEGTSDRVCLEFDITSRPVPRLATLIFQMSNMDDPRYSMISLYHYRANGLANAADYYQDYPYYITTFSDYGVSGTNSYSIDITNSYLESIRMERTFMGILLKANDTNARYDVYSPILTLSY